MRRCPNCQQNTLGPRTVNKTRVIVDVCSLCVGIWFDAGELKASMPVIDYCVDDVPWGARKIAWNCPGCQNPLYEFDYPNTNINVHMCKHCLGFWLYPQTIRTLRHKLEEDRKEQRLEKILTTSSGFKAHMVLWVNTAIEYLSDF